MRVSVGKSEVDVDVDGTRAAYAKLSVPGPEECGCGYCRNWAAQRETTYPEGAKRLLESMGVKPGYETEVWEVPSRDGRHYYSGWYPFIGSVVAKSDERAEIGGRAEMGGMELWVLEGLSYRVPWLPAEGVNEIHFCAIIGWTIEEPEPPGAP